MSVVYEMTSHQASVFTSKSREWRLGRARRSSKLVPFSGDRCNGLYARQRLWGLDNMERVLDEYQYLIDYKSVVLAYSTVSARTILCLANTGQLHCSQTRTQCNCDPTSGRDLPPLT
jgi:hypothetical protein